MSWVNDMGYNDLQRILDNSIIIFKNELWRQIEDNKYIECYGMALRNKNMNYYCIPLSLNCDNMAETLLHEAIHLFNSELTESSVNKLTSFYWNECLEYKKLVQKRLVYELGKHDL